MFRLLSLPLLCAIMVAGCSSRSNSDSSQLRGGELIGKMAPDFTLMDIQGKPFKLSEHRGKPVFLDFWATWCPPCRLSIPEVKKLHAEYASKGVDIAGISVDDRVDKVVAFAAQNEEKHTQLFCGNCDVNQDYNVHGIPMFVIIDKEGRVANVWIGFLPTMPAEWRATLDRLLAS